jgi:hypothetical protein
MTVVVQPEARTKWPGRASDQAEAEKIACGRYTKLDFKGNSVSLQSSFGGQRSIPLGQSSIIRQGEQAQLATFACAVIVPICESDRVKANFDAFLR